MTTKMAMRGLVLTLLGTALAACSPGFLPSSGPGSQATQAPSPASAGLFAVLQGHDYQGQSLHDTVMVLGPDGRARATASFQPRTVPFLGDAGTVLQLEATAARGAVFYVDGTGTVRRLDADGKVTRVTTFPGVGALQMLSFAASPDGNQVLASIVTVPRLIPGQRGSVTGSWAQDLLLARAGAAPVRLKHSEGGPDTYPGGPGGITTIVIVGWDGGGPIADLGASLGTQNAPFGNQHLFGGTLVRLDTAGNVTQKLAGGDCSPFAAPVSGRVVCLATNPGSVSVRSLSGAEVWKSAAQPRSNCACNLGNFSLSPDGSRLAMDTMVVDLANGGRIPLPQSFSPMGWLDPTTVVGGPALHAPGQMGFVSLRDPATLHGLGLQADFVSRL